MFSVRFYYNSFSSNFSTMNAEIKRIVPENSEVYRYLFQFCCGRNKAIKAQVLADQFLVNLREINEEIRCLRKSGALIGSLKEPPYGYYIPADSKEVKEYLDTFQGELFDMLETFNRQKRAKRVFLDSLKSGELFEFKKDTAGQLMFV